MEKKLYTIYISTWGFGVKHWYFNETNEKEIEEIRTEAKKENGSNPNNYIVITTTTAETESFDKIDVNNPKYYEEKFMKLL